MAESTGIAWARSTGNPWIGCEAVSPGCDNCYARVLVEGRMGKDFAIRTRTKGFWKDAVRWNKMAAWERVNGKLHPKADPTWHTPGFWPVFPSLCDPFDNKVDSEWRHDLFDLIYDTPYLTYLLLTKRIGNAVKMLPWTGDHEIGPSEPLGNVWIGASVVNQEEADRDIPKLLATPAAKRFVSYEPALGPVDFREFFPGERETGQTSSIWREGVDWIIVGGESAQGGAKARPFQVEWAHNTIAQCRNAGVACFVKQLGSNVEGYHPAIERVRDRAGADPAEWPKDLRVQQFPKD